MANWLESDKLNPLLRQLTAGVQRQIQVNVTHQFSFQKSQNCRAIAHKTSTYSYSVFTCHNIKSCLKSTQRFSCKQFLYFISGFFFKLLYVYLLKSIPHWTRTVSWAIDSCTSFSKTDFAMDRCPKFIFVKFAHKNVYYQDDIMVE